MKQSPRTQILREAQLNHDFPLKPKPPPPSPASTRKHQNKSSYKENAPPLPPPDPSHSPANKIRNMPLPPRPPSSNPLKRKLSSDSASDTHSFLDSGVKVIVRVRPLSKDEEEGEMIIQKISDDSLMIQDHSFTFDSIADTEATQQDIFELVGAPLVENCLAGFNSSVFAYGQTGSGKTYTMWGPTNALSEGNLCIDQQGLTPRVFQRLFARINEEQLKHADKQLKYQCRCSFLEIYNEQITDLLDPNQRNLQIREDVKSGIYVENLTEEFVFTMKDIMHLLGKGLSNRRTGATSINAESSRSHSVFTCVVESRCKSMADGISNLKTSKINLVDLAGSERQKLTGAAGERLKEAGNINRSLSQLGNLINILAEVSQTGKQRHIPYRDSRLTFLLQESLGGNAKLAMVCAVSAAQSCKSETFSTLRFAHRAKAIKNRAVVNEQMEDDVNHLREIIRQLRDELHRVKANSTNPTGWDTRKSLNILKSLIHPHARLPHLDEDGDEEMEIVEEAVIQADVHSAVSEEHQNGNKNASEDIDVDMEEIFEQQEEHDSIISDEPATKTEGSSDANGQDHNMVHGNDGEESIRLDICSSKEISEEQISLRATCNFPTEESPGRVVGADSSDHLSVSETRIPTDISIAVEPVSPRTNKVYGSPSELSMVPSEECPVLKSPTPSVSPRISISRKSLRTSSMLAVSQKTSKGGENSGHGHVGRSSAESLNGNCFNPLAVHNTKSSLPTTDHIAASLHRGLEIIESHQKRSPFRSSSFGFSFKPVESKPILLVEKVDAGVQTVPPEDEMAEKDSAMFLCVNCKTRTQPEVKDDDDSSNLQLVPVDGSDDIKNSKTQVPKAVEKVLAGAIRREMALEEFCARQASEIMHLNRLVEQYKHERECNTVIGQTREDKILRLESLMDDVLPSDEFMEEEMASLLHQNKLMKEICENHPDVLRTKIELKRVQDELEHYKNFYDLGEREVLLEEIQDLRNHLQYYVDSSSAKKRITLPRLTDSIEPSLVPPLATILESTEDSAEVKLEKERTRWTEMESKWISLAEELRSELDASRMSAEKLRQELHTEKRCAEELKEAMQMAMEGHARMLEQYADLEEKHIQLLARHRKIQEGIDDVKKAASKAGVKGAESKFINALAAEITALKVEREKERRQFRDEKRGLQAQLRDTAEAVQAAGELLVRLKEAEEAVSIAQKRALNEEQEVAKAYIQIDKLKNTHEREINTLNDLLAQSKQATSTGYIGSETTKYDVLDPIGEGDQQWREEFASFYNGEDGALAKSAVPSWFSGYDRCNI